MQSTETASVRAAHCTIEKQRTTYPIYTGMHLLKQRTLFAKHLSAGTKILIVCDANLNDLQRQTLVDTLSPWKPRTLCLKSGEREKNWPTVIRLIEYLQEARFTRQDCLLSLGGGVIGDLSGLAAALYLRGILWIHCPTTLLAQVDAAIGGKTACNHGGIKNLIGTFYHPQAVICDIASLETLPKRAFYAGLAEVVKYGMACDGGFLSWLETHASALRQGCPETLEQTVRRCCQLKSQVVFRDERDTKERWVLNFGHTFAHAIESATDFACYEHGEAVALGMLMATDLALRLKWIQADLLARLQRLLHCFNLPTGYLRSSLSHERIQRSMQWDKKRRGTQLAFVLPTGPGSVRVLTESLEEGLLQATIEAYAED